MEEFMPERWLNHRSSVAELDALPDDTKIMFKQYWYLRFNNVDYFHDLSEPDAPHTVVLCPRFAELKAITF